MDERAIKKVVLDSGHGGADSGTVANGIVEKDYNLKISDYIHKRLDEIKEEIVIYLNNLKALGKNDNNYNLKQYKENRYNYPNHCYYYQPIYRNYFILDIIRPKA